MSKHKPVFSPAYVIPFFFLLFPPSLRASDGFDNNYVGSDANQLLINLDGVPRAMLFGPGQLSTGGYYLDVPNGETLELGPMHTFRLNQAVSFLRSAYLDRVTATTLYYRVYSAAVAPPGWNTVALAPAFFLQPDSCYTTTQSDVWESALQIDLITPGMAAGNYVFEFYFESQLYDVGQESPDPCDINASWQCNPAISHPGRFITTRFTATDPSACNFDALAAALQPPSRVTFSVATSGLSRPISALRHLQVYPNPVSGDRLFIEFTDTPPSGWRWSLIDIGGRSVQSGTQAPFLPVAGLREGWYWLCLFDEKDRLLGRTVFIKR